LIFADGDDFVFFDGEGVMVSFLGFVVIPIFEKDFDALLDGVFFHGFANKLYVSCKKIS
jgi:hypothetical protein